MNSPEAKARVRRCRAKLKNLKNEYGKRTGPPIALTADQAALVSVSPVRDVESI